MCLRAPLLVLLLAFGGPLRGAASAQEGPLSLGSFAGDIQADEFLDPRDGKNFLVSMQLRLEEFPRLGDRTVILSKDETKGAALHGWAIGLNREKTSLRFAVFWKSEDGGGWYLFDHYPLNTRVWYAITLIAVPREYLALYLQEGERGVAPRFSSKVVFLGGVEISKSGVPKSAAGLSLSTLRESRRALRGQISSLLIASPRELPADIEEAAQYVAGGTEAVAQRLGEAEIALLLNEDGEDRSRFRRQLVVSGEPE